MTPIRTTKTPVEVLPYLIRLGGPGLGSDTIDSVDVTVEGSLTAVLGTLTDITMEYTISGGQVDQSPVVRIVVTTVLGAVHEVEHTVSVVR